MPPASMNSVRLLTAVVVATLACTGLSSGNSYARDAQQPLKVFILAGQSNMQGHAHVRTLDALALDSKTVPLLRKLRAKDGSPRVCKDVWISSLSSAGVKHGRLSTGFGADGNKLGPELTFGLTMQELLGEPILLVKTAWGVLHPDPTVRSLSPRERRGKNPASVSVAQSLRQRASVMRTYPVP